MRLIFCERIISKRPGKLSAMGVDRSRVRKPVRVMYAPRKETTALTSLIAVVRDVVSFNSPSIIVMRSLVRYAGGNLAALRTSKFSRSVHDESIRT